MHLFFEFKSISLTKYLLFFLFGTKISIAGFNILADIVTTNRGYPRIYFHGFHYGYKRLKGRGEITTWLCTRSSNGKRCIATVETKYINGMMMMKVSNYNHSCIFRENQHN